MPKQKGIKPVAQNRKARHDYFIEETYECGIALTGTEVKSIRQGGVNLRDSFVRIKNGQAILTGVHISPYEQGNIQNVDPFRDRILLLHKREIQKLAAATMQQGLALIPLSLYFKDGRVKVELALAKGKKLYDKRHEIAKKDQRRELEKEFRVKNL